MPELTVRPVLPRGARIVSLTPPGRDRSIDALRAGSIAVVVLGHWLMATVGPDGTVGNVLTAAPWLPYLTWVFQVVPVFFLVGGYGHGRSLARGRSYGSFVTGRVSRLLPPVGVFLGVWALLALAFRGLGWDHGLVAAALRIVPQPLWFLGVYLGVIGLAPLMWRWHRRHGAAVPVVLGLGVVAVDLFDLPGVLNFALVWLAVHQLGFLLDRLPWGWLLFGGAAGLVLLTGSGAYPVSMVGLPGQASNMNPPTLALLAQSVALTGLVVLVRPALNRWLVPPARWIAVARANQVVMTVFLWHLTALFVLIAVRGGTGPLVTRPLWAAAVLLPLVALFRRFERPGRPASPSWWRAAITVSGAAAVVLWLAVAGL